MAGHEPPVWDACVDFFFVLSGFVICKSISNRSVSLLYFSRKRFWRLFPLHLTVLIIFSFVLFDGDTTLTNLLLDISAIAPLALEKMGNYPAWSMGFEFYMPIALVAFFSKRAINKSVIAGGTLILIIIASAASYQMHSRSTLYFGPFLNYARAFSGLGLGFMAWKIYERGGLVDYSRCNGSIFLLIILGFFGLVIGSGMYPFLGFLLPLLLLAAMFVGARSRTFFSSWLFQWAGRLSFGIYMVHVPVLLAFSQALGPSALEGSFTMKGTMILVSVLIALFLHLSVERPGMRIGRIGHLATRV